MRRIYAFPSVAVCTLTALVAGGLTAQASDTPSSPGSPPETLTQDSRVASPTVTPKVIAPIAAPEMLEEQPLEKPAVLYQVAVKGDFKTKRQGNTGNSELSVSRLNPVSASASTTERNSVIDSAQESRLLPTAAAVKPVEALAEIPKAEASDKMVTELSTPDTNQPASDESLNEKSPKFGSTLPTPEEELLKGSQGGAGISKAKALLPDEFVTQSSTSDASQIKVADAEPLAGNTCASRRIENPNSATYQLAQGLTTPGTGSCPRPEAIQPLTVPAPVAEFESSPALSIDIPVGFGADKNTAFISGTYQNSIRRERGSVGSAGIGIGLGDADKAAGLELSYALANNKNFGEGGFNAKLHRRFPGDVGVALGWNGFLNIGRNDFEHSRYGVITKVFRTQESLNQPFSRVAFTVGLGDGQFRSNGAVYRRDNNVNVFGNVAVRVVRPVSFIAEWTGQDLGLGLSIAPFRNFPLVITPAVRDLVGPRNSSARFVLGVGTALRF